MPGEKHYLKSHTILSYYFRVETGKMSVSEVSGALHIPYSTFIKYVNGETACPSEVMRDFFSATGYLPALQVLTPVGYKIMPIDQAMPDHSSVEGEIMDDILAAAKVCSLWREALTDGRLSAAEKRRVLSALEQARQELEQTINLVSTQPVGVIRAV